MVFFELFSQRGLRGERQVTAGGRSHFTSKLQGSLLGVFLQAAPLHSHQPQHVGVPELPRVWPHPRSVPLWGQPDLREGPVLCQGLGQGEVASALHPLPGPRRTSESSLYREEVLILKVLRVAY
jgi:hypothetical protein